jgi:hypothetical protein
VRKQMDTTVALSVRVSVRNLAIIGTYLDTTGLFTAAQPSGALAYAVRIFADMIVANGLALQPQDLLEAIVMLKRLRYPKGQIEKALLREDVMESRESLRKESQEVFGAVTQGFVKAKQSVREMEERIVTLTPGQLEELKEKAAQFFSEETGVAKIEGQREKFLQLAKEQGMVVSDNSRSAEEINAERAARDAARRAKEREANLEMIRLAKKGALPAVTADEDEFGEFGKVAEEITATQPYVVNADPAEATPGVVETQESLRNLSE